MLLDKTRKKTSESWTNWRQTWRRTAIGSGCGSKNVAIGALRTKLHSGNLLRISIKNTAMVLCCAMEEVEVRGNRLHHLGYVDGAKPVSEG